MVYEVISADIGLKEKNVIVFKSVEDMNKAFKDVDNGGTIYLSIGGVVKLVPNRMISTKLYDGTLTFEAKNDGGIK